MGMACGPLRVPIPTSVLAASSNSASSAAAPGQRSAPGYFASSPSPPPPTSPLPATASARPAMAAAFHHHGMALDWRTCSGGGKSDGAGEDRAAVRNSGGVQQPTARSVASASRAAPSAGGEAAAANSDGPGDPSREDGSGARTGPVGFFVPQVGSGTSFFGSQGLFMWTPSVGRQRLPGEGTPSAWGGGAAGPPQEGQAFEATHHPPLGSWGGGGIGYTRVDEPWDSALREGTPPPAAEVIATEQPVSEGEGAGMDGRVGGNVAKTTDDHKGEDNLRPKKEGSHESPVKAKEKPGDRNDATAPKSDAAVNGGADGERSPATRTASPGDDTAAAATGEAIVDYATPVLAGVADGERDAPKADGSAVVLADGGGHSSTGTNDESRLSASAVREPSAPKVPVAASIPVVVRAEDKPSTAASSATAAAAGAAPAVTSDSQCSGGGRKCCMCACHDAQRIRLPPTPPPARTRLSRRQQRRRASAPEKQPTTAKGGGGNGCAGGSGEKEEMDGRGSAPGVAIAAGKGGRAPRALGRNLSEEARRPPILGQQPVAFTQVLPTASAPVAGDGGVGGPPVPPGVAAAASPERGKSDYTVGTPPRSERPQPRSGGSCGGGGGGGGSSNGGRGGRGGRAVSSSSSVPAPRLSNVRRRKSESGLGLMAAAANRHGDAYPGSAGGKLRTKRAGSAASASNVVVPAQAAKIAQTGTPPVWTWSAFNVNDEPQADAPGGDGAGKKGSRGRSDSDAPATPLGRPPADDLRGSSTVEGWNRDRAASGSGGGGGGGDGRGRSRPFPLGARRVGQDNEASIIRNRAGSWDSDPRDGFEFRIDRDLQAARAGARSAPRRGATRRIIPDGTRSVSEAAGVRRLDDPVYSGAGERLL